MNRIELTGKDGGPIRYDDAIRRIDERRAELLGGASVVDESRKLELAAPVNGETGDGAAPEDGG